MKPDLLADAEKVLAATLPVLQQGELTAARRLAEHYASRYDKTPVDEAWLRSIGGDVYKTSSPTACRFVKGQTRVYLESYSEDKWRLFYSSVLLCENTSRGQVLRLLDALGITANKV